MANRKQAVLGLCPIGKFVFSHEDAVRFKGLIRERLDRWQIRYVDLDEVLPDGMVRDQKHVAPVVRYFQEQRIDALFIPHCNFGTEGAAAMIAKRCAVPTLLWGPRDERALADGSRLRDSLCGMLATSGVLHALRVPFTYIDNCRIDEEPFRQGVERFVRAAQVVKTVKTMKIGQIGQRIDFFWSTVANEAELLERFGIQVLPIDAVNLIRAIRERVAARRAGYQAELAQFRQWIAFNHFPDDDSIFSSLAFRDLLVEIAQREELDGFCFQTFDSFPAEFRAFLCFGCALVDDAGYPVAPESDLQGAVSSVLLEAASGSSEPSFSAGHHHPPPGQRQCRVALARRRSVLAASPQLARETRSPLDPQGPAHGLGSFPAQRRTTDTLPLCRHGRRLPARLWRGAYGARALHAGVLYMDGGRQLARLGAAVDSGPLHPPLLLLLWSLCRRSGGSGPLFAQLAGGTFWRRGGLRIRLAARFHGRYGFA